MAKLEGIKWALESEDQRIKFDLMTNYSDVDGVASFGRALFDGKKVSDVKAVLPDDFFKKKRKSKGGNKMLTYALAYYLSLYIVKTVERKSGNKTSRNKKDPAELAADLLNLNEKSSIWKAKNLFEIPSGAKIIVHTDPLGIIVLLDEKSILQTGDGGIIYKGQMWTWKQGDDEAKKGSGEIRLLCNTII